MSTQLKKLSTDWQQITDGQNPATVQVMGGWSARVYIGKAAPAADAAFHVIGSGLFTINPPAVAWIKQDSGRPASVVISDMQS